MTALLPEELPPQSQFGGYLIHECIGRGGMARVYRAEHTTLRKPVAIKVLDRWVLEKPGGAERFLREARTAASIKHPNVVDIVDVGVWSDRPFIVMELLSGCDLDSELERRGPLPDSEVVGLALPIIAGMIAVHEAGVVHRDIKPSNIFLAAGSDSEMIPKVLDFGISKFSDHLIEPIQGLTGTREIVGTPTYMAPEALEGARELGPRADQYALGAVLYDCAVGRPPFEGETLLELLKAIAIGEIAAPRSVRPEISVALEGAILKAMSSNPQERFETLRDLGRALWPMADERSRLIWQRSFGGGPVLDWNRTTNLAVIRKKRQRSTRAVPARRWVGALAALAAVGMLVGYGFLRNRNSTETASRAGATPESRLQVERPSLSPQDPATISSPVTSSPVASSPVASRSDGQARPEAANGSLAAGNSSGAATAAGRLTAQAASSPAQDAPRNRASRGRLRGTRSVVPANAGRLKLAASRGDTTDLDPDLNELFESPSLEGGDSRATSADSDLGGLFPPEGARTIGTNGSPLLD
jgi:serine/threonine protein kinase